MNTKSIEDKAGCFYKDGVVYQQADGGVVLALSLEAVAARVQADGDEDAEEGLIDALAPEVVDEVPDGAIDFRDIAFICGEDALCEIEDAWVAYEERSSAA